MGCDVRTGRAARLADVAGDVAVLTDAGGVAPRAAESAHAVRRALETGNGNVDEPSGGDPDRRGIGAIEVEGRDLGASLLGSRTGLTLRRGNECRCSAAQQQEKNRSEVKLRLHAGTV